jgi:hypothetical protein
MEYGLLTTKYYFCCVATDVSTVREYYNIALGLTEYPCPRHSFAGVLSRGWARACNFRPQVEFLLAADCETVINFSPSPTTTHQQTAISHQRIDHIYRSRSLEIKEVLVSKILYFWSWDFATALSD